ncbi:glycosyltransferase [Anaerosacchariphilus polymeriproducens]|uniref:UDP-glucoronosyl and UDP-glucosyl transferase n=1 Tax=Anaerosacchariphilus polymeriproducens TaxID=1812858 RepID=A0A371AV59_9FIRM|nr:nucleotide disphospho-sugar-binding domain-containing protein [Anaerosacchariphilus polymeriproducens]RDU23429.1 UDP-glucoronosyl and UDP-glucosyl transferase [Anaerosacchariphilus polymeriproducens]
MKILIVPMAAMVETSGPFSRAKTLANAFINQGSEVALCAAKDVNYEEIEGVRNYYIPIPIPLGLPAPIGKRVFPIVGKLGLLKAKTVHSFEEVLHLTGAISYSYFYHSVSCIRDAIKDFDPDFVYAEANMSAIVAALVTQKPVITSYSYPIQSSFASTPKYCKGVNRVLNELNLPEVKSTLDLMELADLRVIPSSYDLEPVDKPNTIFTGPFHRPTDYVTENNKNKILAYMGNGTISQKILVQELRSAFEGSEYELYIAGRGLKKEDKDNIHINDRFNFSELLPSTAVYINHGGQNSIMDAIFYEVPQIICPGKVFERKYNAKSIADNHAGIYLSESGFQADKLKQLVEKVTGNKDYEKNAKRLKDSLSTLGGTDEIIKQASELVV